MKFFTLEIKTWAPLSARSRIFLADTISAPHLPLHFSLLLHVCCRKNPVHEHTHTHTRLIRLAAVQDGFMTPCFHNQLDEDPLGTANINSGRQTCGAEASWAHLPSPAPAKNPVATQHHPLIVQPKLFCLFFWHIPSLSVQTQVGHGLVA